MLGFVKMLFLQLLRYSCEREIYIYIYLSFISLMCCIRLVSCGELTLLSWDKLCLVMLYTFFFFNWISLLVLYFHFCSSCIHKVYCSVLRMTFSGFGVRQYWHLRISWAVFFCLLKFIGIGVSSSSIWENSPVQPSGPGLFLWEGF